MVALLCAEESSAEQEEVARGLGNLSSVDGIGFLTVLLRAFHLIDRRKALISSLSSRIFEIVPGP